MKAASKPRMKRGTKLVVCTACYYDESLDAEDQFGNPRGTDIRTDHGLTYCGTCGDDSCVEEVKVVGDLE